MRFSSVIRIIVKGPTGDSIWRETRDLRLPSGGKKLSFRQVSLYLFSLLLAMMDTL